jgi:uncharacterized protein YecE (DUF72 family)
LTRRRTTRRSVCPRSTRSPGRTLAYLRAHGRNADGYLGGRTAGERFAVDSSDDELHKLPDRARRLAATAATVRLMFGKGGHALASSRRMREILAIPSSLDAVPANRMTIAAAVPDVAPDLR